MTIHKSKGLEFNAVLVDKLNISDDKEIEQ